MRKFAGIGVAVAMRHEFDGSSYPGWDTSKGATIHFEI